jgi:Zn-dependent protease/uncharacterized protein YndB with AHSA1/START domain
MTQLILGLYYAFADIARALFEVVMRRGRSRYVASGVINAPVAAVWELLLREDTTFVGSNTRMRVEPLEGHDGVLVALMTQGAKSLPALAYSYEALEPEKRIVSRYLAALSSRDAAVGDNDTATIDLVRDGETATRITFTRDITHRGFATRISAPVGVRSAVLLTKGQVEHEAGVTSARAPHWHQLVWTALAFLSFAWLLDWRTALAIMAIIAIHELGHALAMLWYGLGLNFVSFVPFLGGVAAPKRYYETEWQRGIVALMGVAFSLPFSIAALWLVERYSWPNLGIVVILSIIINGVNLIPFPALDGSVVVSMLLSRLHKNLNLAVSIVMFGVFVAVGIIYRDPMIWAAIALSFVSIVQVVNLRFDDHLVKLGRAGVAAMIAFYIALIGAHALAFRVASESTARAEANIFLACLRTNGNTADMRKFCRDDNKLWLFRR